MRWNTLDEWKKCGIWKAAAKEIVRSKDTRTIQLLMLKTTINND
jgi:hypothetical protein